MTRNILTHILMTFAVTERGRSDSMENSPLLICGCVLLFFAICVAVAVVIDAIVVIILLVISAIMDKIKNSKMK